MWTCDVDVFVLGWKTTCNMCNKTAKTKMAEFCLIRVCGGKKRRCMLLQRKNWWGRVEVAFWILITYVCMKVGIMYASPSSLAVAWKSMLLLSLLHIETSKRKGRKIVFLLWVRKGIEQVKQGFLQLHHWLVIIGRADDRKDREQALIPYRPVGATLPL